MKQIYFSYFIPFVLVQPATHNSLRNVTFYSSEGKNFNPISSKW